MVRERGPLLPNSMSCRMVTLFQPCSFRAVIWASNRAGEITISLATSSETWWYMSTGSWDTFRVLVHTAAAAYSRNGIRARNGSHLFSQKRFIFCFLSDICRAAGSGIHKSAGLGPSMDTDGQAGPNVAGFI